MRDYYTTATINNFNRKEKEMRRRKERIADYINGILCLIVFVVVTVFAIIYVTKDDNNTSGYWTKNPDFISFELTPDEEPSIWVEEGGEE